jgi:hypothetical protein
MTYTSRRTIVTLKGLLGLTLKVCRCPHSDCRLYRRPYRPEEEGFLALPQSEFGLEVIAWVGHRRYRKHESVPELHRSLRDLGVDVCERSVTHLVHRYEELVALRLTENSRVQASLRGQGRAILALDGLQPDVGHEVLWVLRECLSGEVLLARSLLGATAAELEELLVEVKEALPVPVAGVISDGQLSIRNAVRSALPGVPHQLCQFHYFREAARTVYEADRHAKKELKKLVRGVRPIERSCEQFEDHEAEAVRGYCLAVRSALTDDGRPPLDAPGLRLMGRLGAIRESLKRVQTEKGGCQKH